MAESGAAIALPRGKSILIVKLLDLEIVVGESITWSPPNELI